MGGFSTPNSSPCKTNLPSVPKFAEDEDIYVVIDEMFKELFQLSASPHHLLQCTLSTSASSMSLSTFKAILFSTCTLERNSFCLHTNLHITLCNLHTDTHLQPMPSAFSKSDVNIKSSANITSNAFIMCPAISTPFSTSISSSILHSSFSAQPHTFCASSPLVVLRQSCTEFVPARSVWPRRHQEEISDQAPHQND